jgi:UPF0755 protein
VVVGIAGVVAFALIAAVVWYQLSLRPVSSPDAARIKVEIAAGSSPTEIGQLLQDKKLIRSSAAFDIYTRLTGVRAKLQAGTYRLSPSDSLGDITTHIVSGKVDQFQVTFFPGATLRNFAHVSDEKKRTDVEGVLLKAGFSQTEIDTALAKSYSYKSLFADKPTGTTLEGYIYGETYTIDSATTVEQLLMQTFEEYDKAIEDNHLMDGFKAHGLTTYQAITLASIIQREVATPSDMRQVAQVFYKRLAMNMTLGSDVTYQYAADKLGVARDTNLDSPYNTRRYTGLPPGPIAVPGLTALKAVADPAPGDYLFFLSGDDDKTYFSTTAAEHEANIRDHCQVKCATP